MLGTVAALALASAVGCSASDDGSGTSSTGKTTSKTTTTTATTTSTTTAAASTYVGFATANEACVACLPKALDGTGPCAPQYQACAASAACADGVKCYESCLGVADQQARMNCIVSCSGNSKDNDELYKAYLNCTCCNSQCTTDCKATCDLYQNPPAGPAYCQ
jgi:hypothetical protein